MVGKSRHTNVIQIKAKINKNIQYLIHRKILKEQRTLYNEKYHPHRIVVMNFST